MHVEAPTAGRGLAHVAVLGAAGQTFGLGFSATGRSRRAAGDMRARCGLAEALEDLGRQDEAMDLTIDLVDDRIVRPLRG